MNKDSEKQPTIPQTCDLCGLPLRHGTVTAIFSETTYSFCCLGCRQVFNILIEATDSADPAAFKKTDLFKQCLEKGIIPASEAELAGRSRTTAAEDIVSIDRLPADPAQTLSDPMSSQFLPLTLKISNMWCPACAWLIDESLKKAPGIRQSRCNFSPIGFTLLTNPFERLRTALLPPLRNWVTGRPFREKPGRRSNAKKNFSVLPSLHF